MSFLYDQALQAEKMGNFEAMERLLRALALLRNRITTMGSLQRALGYSFADRNIRLASPAPDQQAVP
ncbi:MAG: hypothetical protein IPI16_19350 [Comamonadaceae bacterium]|nr:hypothetical protein [Comamonadaceae bacterium]